MSDEDWNPYSRTRHLGYADQSVLVHADSRVRVEVDVPNGHTLNGNGHSMPAFMHFESLPEPVKHTLRGKPVTLIGWAMDSCGEWWPVVYAEGSIRPETVNWSP